MLKDINLNKLPKHIAIIMDGNGRWAKAKGKNRFFGHIEGVKTVKKIVECALSINIQYLTLFAFSQENWQRPKKEINMLMDLFMSTMIENEHDFLKNDVKINVIGNTLDLPKKCQKAINKMLNVTKNNKKLTLTLALSYSARSEILNAVNSIVSKSESLKTQYITEGVFEKHLQTFNLPDPELLIRTSGEKRVSNFLLWQIAFTELHFSEKKWPDFNVEELYIAIFEYQKRERRFGKTTEQIIDEKN